MPELNLRERALRFLARREYARDELARKLALYTEDRDEITALLDDFTQRGWLSEARFIAMTVQARREKFGSRRIAHELREKGVSEEAIAAILPEVRDSDLENARKVWAKKFGCLPLDGKEKAKQMRFLMGRGFGAETIAKVLKQQESEQ